VITSPLLEKTRRINKILQKTAGQRVDFTEVSEVLKNVIHANVYIADRGRARFWDMLWLMSLNVILWLARCSKNLKFPERYNDFLLRDDETRVNLKTKKKCLLLSSRKKTVFLQTS